MPTSMNDWMQMWQGMAHELMQMAAPPALPAVSVATDRMLDLQRDYMPRLTELWGDFVEHPDRTTAPIKDSR